MHSLERDFPPLLRPANNDSSKALSISTLSMLINEYGVRQVDENVSSRKQKERIECQI